VASRDVKEDIGVLSDHTIVLAGQANSKRYPEKFGLIHYYDA
jgi:hypothetical protein